MKSLRPKFFNVPRPLPVLTLEQKKWIDEKGYRVLDFGQKNNTVTIISDGKIITLELPDVEKISNSTYMVTNAMGLCTDVGLYINLNEIETFGIHYSLPGLNIRTGLDSDYDKWCLIEGPIELPNRDLNRAVRIAYEEHIASI